MNVRAARPDDAVAIARICNEISQELYGESDVDESAVRDWFALPNLQLLVAERNGSIAGYADVRNDEGARFPIDVRVRDRDVADPLLAAVEEWAQRHAKPGALLRGYAAERDANLGAAFAGRGYRVVRHSFNMLIDLSEEIDAPVWPDRVAVRTFEPEDEQAVYECVQESFADHWDFHRVPIEEWRTYVLAGERFDPQLLWLVEDRGELAGVCLNSWHFSGDTTFGWIGTLGVRRPWRKRGLGRALLLHSFRDFKERGATRVGLSVDGENTTGAVRLYENAGMRPVRRSDSYVKPIAS